MRGSIMGLFLWRDGWDSSTLFFSGRMDMFVSMALTDMALYMEWESAVDGNHLFGIQGRNGQITTGLFGSLFL